MNEKEKMEKGQWFLDCEDGLKEQRIKAANASIEFNQAKVDDPKRKEILEDLLAEIGENSDFGTGVQFFYGCYTHVGKNVYINYNAVMLDGGEIHIGDNCLIGPNSAFLTITHPMYAPERCIREDGNMLQKAMPIVVEHDVWMGGNVTVLPGVTIGANSIIGAGSVINKDVPENSLVVGNPCRVLREITEEDKLNLL